MTRSSVCRRRVLLAGASAVTLLLSVGAVHAGTGALAQAIASGSGTGTGAGNAANLAAALAQSAQAVQQAATATRKVNADLATAAQSVRSALAAQAAAAAAGTTNAAVTDGLSSGGLIVDPRVLASNYSDNYWANISAPSQSVGNGQTTVTLTQTSQRAIATWAQFNVGKNTTVHFDQSAGNTSAGNSWTVLNRIDATGSPSRILGTIKAEGTVLLINPNGIVFGAGSQVNVHSLIAAAMDINSYGSAGVFNACGATVSVCNGDYVNVGTTAGGGPILAPNNESNGNTQFLSNGLFADGTISSNGSLILSMGTGTGSFGSAGGSGGYSVGPDAGIVVEKGAAITTTNNVSGFDNGGTVALLGPSVTNQGSVSTSAGQIILAAGSNVVITSPASTADAFTVLTQLPSAHPSLTANPTATASGLIVNDTDAVLSSGRGNITLAGADVEQLGVAEATTSITRTGSITIVAIGSTTTPGTLTFGPASVTQITAAENGETMPESAVANDLANNTLPMPSIAITTTNMEMQGGSLIVAPSAAMTVNTPSATVTSSAGRVLLDSGSTIDLGGMQATAKVSDYLYTFKVTANDVADTPLAKSLIGQTVTIDLRLSGTRADGETWVGSPLFAATGSGYLGDVAYSVDQLLTTGGSLKIGSSGAAFVDVLSAPGATLNLSGGAILYSGGTISTTNLVTATGQVVNIGSANPFVTVAGLAGTVTVRHSRWGVTDTYTNPLTAMSGYTDAGYTDGMSAGGIGVAASNPILEGAIVVDTLTGIRQANLAMTSAAAGLTTPDALPTGASLAVTFILTSDVAVLDGMAPEVLGADVSLTSPLTLPTDAAGHPVVTYSTDQLTAENFGSVTIKGASLSMAKGASLTVRPGGGITFGSVTGATSTGATIISGGVTAIDGALIAHGGKISLTGDIAATALTIGPDALLDVSGLWVNDAGRDNGTLRGAAWINGGSITLATAVNSAQVAGSGHDNGDNTTTYRNTDTTASIILAAGSVVDLSSGGYVTSAGALKTGSDGLPVGNGGDLTLQTYVGTWSSATVVAGNTAPNRSPSAPTAADNASVYLNGTIYAAGLNKGGTFTLQAPTITIDGAATAVATDTATGTVTLPTSFFASGFSTYDLIGTYGNVTVAAGTTLSLKQQNYLIAQGATLPATGATLRAFAGLGYAPDGERQPVNLTLTQQGFGGFSAGYVYDPVNPAGILIDSGAAIVADPQATITLTANGWITVLGGLIAPAGIITLTDQNEYLAENGTAMVSSTYTGAQDIWIGANARLDVSGIYVPNPLITAYATGNVLDAGTITLASDGAIVALIGSTFDLAGTNATVQEPAAAGLGSGQYMSQAMWSNGGTLSLIGMVVNGSTPSLYFAGTIDAAGGSASASGGTLNIGTVTYSSSIGGITESFSSLYNNVVITRSGDVTVGFAGAAVPTTAGELSSLMSGVAFTTTSTTNNTVPAAAGTTLTFVIQAGLPRGLLPGNAVTVRDGNGDSMTGTVKSYDPATGELVVYASAISGTAGATASAWTIAVTNAAAFVTADTLNTAHLDSLSLVGTTLNFSGNASLRLRNALYLNGNVALLPAGITPSSGLAAYTATAGSGGINSIGAPTVTLGAGYIRWLSATQAVPVAGDGTLTLAATAQIDLAGTVSAAYADNVTLAVSGGDIRFLPTTDPDISGYLSNAGGYNLTFEGGSVAVNGALLVPGDLTLSAREVYPASGMAFLAASLGAGGTNGGTVTVASNGQAPYTPYSAGGAVLVDAATIVQGGVIEAPLGSIILGLGSAQSIGAATTVPTSSITLAAGSLTSTSAAGIVIPYGTTTNGTDWSANSATPSSPPAKLIVLGGASVTTQSGAIIDEAGGGDIYATEFVRGTGGTRNVLATNTASPYYGTSQTVYALLPTYEAKVAAYDSTFVSTYDTTTAVGSAVTLAGGNGIAAGTYVLMPAMYATLPGAYRVVVVSTNTGRAAGLNSVTADGSTYVTATLSNVVTGAASSKTALLQIQSNATWTQYSRIDISGGNSYFAQQAANSGTIVPRLPEDAGQLVVAATNALSLQATNDFTPAAGGRGGLIDITGSNILVRASDLVTPAADANYLVIDADQVSDLGVDSVLIGGLRSFGSGGTVISATADNLEVETDAAHPLSGPELLLATVAHSGANGLTADAGSVIKAVGAVSAGDDNAITFAAASQSGSLLRLSNGQMVSVTRSGASATGASLAIGTDPGTWIVDAAAGVVTIAGGAALTLDSSGDNRIADNAVLPAANYDLSGSVVNIGGGSGGLMLSPALIADFAGATSVLLRSAGVFNLYDAAGLTFGSAANPIGTLTFDGAGLYSQGGNTTINAGNIALINSQGVSGTGITGAGGTLTLNASGTITDGVGSKSLGGFGQVFWNAGREILFTGAGSTDAGPVAGASLTLNVGGVAVEQSGAGYTSVPTVTIADGGNGGSTATATASLGVVSIAVTAGGSGYTDGDVVTVTDGTASATGKAVVNSSGAIIGVTITAKGGGFLAAGGSVSVSVISPGGGTGASFSASLGVVGISVASAGSDYTGIPVVSISGGGGTGATAQALAAVTGMTLTNGGDGYSGTPVVTISGGGGTGGSATANVAGGVVTGVALVSGGSGYSSMPTVTFSGGDGGAADFAFSAPAIVVDGSASQSLQTTGRLTIGQAAGDIPTPASGTINGSLKLTAGIIADSGTVLAPAGTLTMTATAGDLTLSDNALLNAGGSLIQLGELTEAIPGGTIKLIADAGNVTLGAGTTIDVSAAGTGYAGTLGIEAANGTATLAGTLKGGGAYNDLGGSFILVADRMAGSLPIASGFTGAFEAELTHGDIVIAPGQTLTANTVLLATDGGSIVVTGTIDASGQSAGSIALYGSGTTTDAAGTAGATGVTLGSSARLYARYQADDVNDPAFSGIVSRNGGTITVGTSGTPDGTTNATLGYENVSASGAVAVASGAILDVSGGSGAIGGAVYIRAPLLTSGNANVSFAGTVVTNATASGAPSGNGVVLNAFAVWSTTDATSGGVHFDGVIDPAGFFGADGAQFISKDANGLYPSSTADSPASGANIDHVTFYQTTLLNFVEDPFNGNDAAVAADFAGARIQVSGADTALTSSPQLQLRPEIDLINPSTAINSGNITVASNWNLGAGAEDAGGNVTLLYRTGSGEPGVVAMRAANKVLIEASITDGFYTPYSTSDIAQSAYDTETASSLYQSYLSNFANELLTYSGQSISGITYVADNNFYDITQGLFNTLEFTLQPPIAMTCGSGSNCATLTDQYKQFYVEYVKLFDIYSFYVYCANQGGPACGSMRTGSVTSYADFLSTYGVTGTTSDLPAFPTQPTNSNLYYNIKNNGIITLGGTSDYASAYATYIVALYDDAYADIFNGAVVTDPASYIGAVTGLSYGSSYALADLETAIVTTGYPIRLGAAPPYAPAAYTTLYASTYVATSTVPPPADQIANNPTTYNNAAVYNTTTAADLMTATVSGKGSFSYDIVAGAKFYTTGSSIASAVDPNAVLTSTALSSAGLAGDVVVGGHSTYTDAQNTAKTIPVGTVVRTGTGVIDIAASGSFELTDTTAPGAVYTAGAAVDLTTVGDFTAPSLTTAYTSAPNGLVNTPVWGKGGGSVSIAAGGDITCQDVNGAACAGSALTNWESWYYHIIDSNGNASGQFAGNDSKQNATKQTAAWVNYATYGGGIGALGGGNVTLTAGGSIRDIVVSLPETILASGGTAATPTAAEHTYGGGNLTVKAGGDVGGGGFLVGAGSGMIRVGGAAAADGAGNALQLAVQDGSITVIANGAITLGGIYDPAEFSTTTDRALQAILTTYMPSAALPDGTLSNSGGSTPYVDATPFLSYGDASGVSLTSLSGDVTIAASSNTVMPATLAIDAVGGNILFSGSPILDLIPSPTGTLTLLAGGSIKLYSDSATSVQGSNIAIAMWDDTNSNGNLNGRLDALGLQAPSALPAAVHAGDDTPALIYAGSDIVGGNITLIKPAEVWAGRDIVNLVLTGQNNNATDITSIVAGRDILASAAFGLATSILKLYGPGDFLVEAGRNLGPFTYGTLGTGILTLGDGSGTGDANAVKSYLPVAGANITTLFGVGNGIDYAAAISDYVATATGGIDFLPSITQQLENTLDTLVTQGKSNAAAAGQLRSLLAAWGLPAVAMNARDTLVDQGVAANIVLSTDEARSIFQTDLSTAKQHLLVDHALVDFLTQVSTDYGNSTSPYYHQYARAYQAINTLFPASRGYTDNNTGGSSGASATVRTGNLQMGFSLIETQTGGDITILGPGGTAYVGSNATDNSTPSSEGILTLQGGSIGVYTDGSIELSSSRVFTEQGGNVGLFSANANIDAGAGLQSSSAYPPYFLVCDVDGYCRVNPQGLVSGAGIGALVTVAGQDPTKSNVSLTAPHGTVDAGAAGIRAGGNVNIVALQVLNAFNISAGGTVSGVPVAATPNLGALMAASNTAGSSAAAAEAASRQSRQTTAGAASLPSIITVEVIGYGGGDGNAGAPPAQPGQNDRQGRLDADDPVRVVGYGPLSASQTGDLTAEERRKLMQP